MKIETVNMDSILHKASGRIRNPDIVKALAAFSHLSNGEVLKCMLEDVKSAENIFVRFKYYQNRRGRPGLATHPDMRLCRRGNLVFVWKEPTQE